MAFSQVKVFRAKAPSGGGKIKKKESFPNFRNLDRGGRARNKDEEGKTYIISHGEFSHFFRQEKTQS